MADNTTTFTLKLKTEGMDQAQKGSQSIRDNLEAAQKAAAGTATSRKVASSAAAMPTGAAGVSAGIGGREVEEYNRAAGTAGKAGGTARDFADQARGLGGLVRLYATVAANVFAATAAFNALSKAMDTTNMVKGLDQLGAASGQSLGTLSKRLADSTEGAVSLREAMEATVKASSAGLNTDQIMKMGDVAKKASQALGINMTDSLSRLSRGISKLEPELLDELGIFVKIDDATTKYALSVGKSVSALTDFERRQAFANAVLEQGAKKFGDIKVDVNPYTKLAATIQNLAQSFLEFINKGLGPVAKFLSDNTTLLAGAFAFIALKLTQAALPALGQWQTGLIKAAETAKTSAREINTSFGEAFVQRWTEKLRIPELKKEVETAKASLQSLASTAKLEDMGKGKAALTRILGGEAAAKDIRTVNNLISEQTKKYEEALAANNNRQNATTRALRADITLYESAIKQSTLLVNSTKELTEANKKFEKSAIESQLGLGERARQSIANAADRKAQMYTALADVNKNVLEKGLGDSLKTLNEQLNVKGVGYIRRFTGLAIGAFSAVTTSIGIFASAIQGYLAIFTFLIGIGAAILDFFSNTKKETEATNESFARLDGTLKTTRDTLERISMAKDPLEKLSIESIQARGTALKELGDSVVLAQRRAADEISKMNWADKTINIVKSLWGGDVQTKMAEGLADSIKQAFKLAEQSDTKEQARKTVEKLLGTTIESKNLGDVVSKIATSKDKDRLKEIVQIIEKLGNAAAVSGAKGTELKDSIKKLGTTIQEINKSFVPTDPLSKFAIDSADSAKKLDIALKDPVQSLNAMREASSNIDMLAMFPPEVASTLQSYSTQLNQIAREISSVSTLTPEVAREIQTLQDELDYLNSPQARRGKGIKEGGEGAQTEASRQAREELDRQIEETKNKLQDLKNIPIKLRADIEKTDLDPIKEVFQGAVRASLVKSAEMMASRIAVELAKARSAVINTIAGVLGDTEVGIKLRAQEEQKMINATMESTKQMFELGSQVEALKLAVQRKAVQDERYNLELVIKDLRKAGAPVTEQEKQLDAIKKREAQLISAEKITSGEQKFVSSTQVAKSGGSDEEIKAAQRFEQMRAQLAGAQAQKRALSIKTEIELLSVRQKLELETINNNIANLSTSKQNLDLQRQTGVLTEAQFNAELYSLELKQKSAEVSKQRTEAQNEYNILMEAGNKLVLEGKSAEAEQTYQLAEGKKLVRDRLITEQFRIDLTNLNIQAIERELKTTLELIDRQASLKQLEQDIVNIKEDTAIKLQDIELQTAEQTNAYTEKYLSSLKYEAEVAKIVEEAKRKETTLTTQYKVEQERLFQQIASELQKSGGEGTEKSADLAQKMTLSAEKYRADVQGIKSVTAAQLAQVSAIRAAKTEQDSFNSSLEAIKTFESVFTSMGSAVSNLVSSLGDAVKAQDQYNASREALNKKISSETDEKKKVELTEQLADLDKQRAKDELTANAKLMGSAKNLFKEKTAAYKAFAAVEKALHIARIAMEFKELATSLFVEKGKVAGSIAGEAGQTAATGAGLFARAGLYVTEIFSKISAQLGIFGPPVAAAIVAAIGLSAFGGGSKAPPGGFTAEEQNPVQGTGQTYRNGELVTREGGVPGDPTARASSLTKSLELVGNNTFKNLEYSNKMVDALKAIERNTRGLSAAMMRSLNPESETSLPRQIQQGQTRGNYISGGVGTALGAGLGYAGGLAAGVGLMSSGLGMAATGAISGLLGVTATTLIGTILPGIGLLLAKPFGKLMGSIFGGKTTQTIEAFGVSVNGVLDDVIKGTKGVIEEWANVKTVRKGGWFRSDKTTFRTQEQEAAQAVKDLVGSLFLGVKDTMLEAGKVLGVDLTSQLSTYLIKDFKINAKDLKPEELTAAIQGEVSIAFNKMASDLLPQFEQFAEPFEEAGATIVRLARQVQVFDLAMTSIGGTLTDTINASLDSMTITETTIAKSGGFFNNDMLDTALEKADTGFTNLLSRIVKNISENLLNGADSISAADLFGKTVTTTVTRPLTEAEKQLKRVEISNDLIKLAGGMEQFLEKVNFFAENFLTQEERLAPVQRAVTTELNKLGLGFVDTREEFKAVVNAIDLTVPAGRELYNSLMNLAPGFAEVYKETQKALSVEEMRSKVLSQQISILKLLGKDEEALAIQRAEELAELAKYPKAQADILIANQNYIYALEDEKSLKDKLIKQRDKEKTALNNTINSLKSSITTLENYRTALVGGDKSILTPLEKYQQSQTEFLKLQATALGPAGTEAEKAAQADAINKLPAAADKFLESSRTLFASSGRYTEDFNQVLATVDKTTSSLTVQKSNAELQLDELTRTTSFLDAIEDNTLTTANLLTQYLSQQQTTQTLAKAATLPEPQKPQEVAEVTDKAVVAEIVKTNIELAQLRKELEKLRTEQQAQTGAIITSNAEAINNNGRTVGDVIKDTFDNQGWYDRQVVDLP